MSDSATYRRLLRIIARYGRRGQLVIDAALEELFRSAPSEAEIEQLLRAGRGWEIEDAAKRLDDSLSVPLRAQVVGAVDMMAVATAREVAADYGREINARFLLARAADAARAKSSQLITVITEETRQTIRGIIADKSGGARPWQEAALDVRRVIGLNRPQAASLDKYAAELYARSDIDDAKRARMIERERRRLIKQRSKVIAQTEMAASANLGQSVAWKQGQADGILPRDIYRRWVLSADPCERCNAIGENQPVALDEPFFSAPDRGGDGQLYHSPPVHPQCACGVRLERPS